MPTEQPQVNGNHHRGRIATDVRPRSRVTLTLNWKVEMQNYFFARRKMNSGDRYPIVRTFWLQIYSFGQWFVYQHKWPWSWTQLSRGLITFYVCWLKAGFYVAYIGEHMMISYLVFYQMNQKSDTLFSYINTLCLKKKHVTTFFAITGTMNVRL